MEEEMGAIEDQSLTFHTKKNYKKKENHHHNKKKDKKQKKIKRDPSNVRCYTCDEKGHFARDCPIRKKRDIMLMLSKMMNQQTKYLGERRMIQMKSIC